MTRTTLRRKLGARTALVASMIGMTVVLTSVIFFFVEDDFRRILGVIAGLFFLLLATYYAAHPFFREERSSGELRHEVQVCLDLTKQLHYAAIRGDDRTFESITEKVPAHVENLIEAARRSEVEDGGTE